MNRMWRPIGAHLSRIWRGAAALAVTLACLLYAAMPAWAQETATTVTTAADGGSVPPSARWPWWLAFAVLGAVAAGFLTGMGLLYLIWNKWMKAAVDRARSRWE